MDCARFEEALFEQLEGTLDGAEREPMRAHASDCRECRALQAAVLEGHASAVAPADLAAAILAATSGSPCGRAQQLCSERAGAALFEADDALETHLANCLDCRGLSRALERLRLELPQLADLQPDGDFVTEVMTATVTKTTSSGLGRAWSRWWSGSGASARGSVWEAFARRPRLALEGAYAGTFALFLFVGFPGAPLAELPPRLLTELEQQGVEMRQTVAAGAYQLTAVGGRRWTESAQRLVDYVDVCDSGRGTASTLSDFARCWRRASEDRIATTWRDHVNPIIESMQRLRLRVLGLADPGEQTREQNDGTIDASA